jgi:hypothetical protein
MTYDINILGELTASSPAYTFDGTCIDGIAKLVQRFMIVLFSDNRTETYGTDIPRILEQVNIVDMGALDNIFRIAMADVSEILTANTPAGTPDDEVLQGYDFILENTDEDEVFIEITITALSGDSTVAKLPTDFTIKED